jgi:hypothetical protein
MSCEPGCITCEELRAAALGIVGAGGLEALSREALGEALAVEPEQVGRHYGTAHECLFEMYEQLSCDVLLDMVNAFRQADTWEAQVESVTRRLVTRFTAKPGEARIIFIESMRDPVLTRRRAINRGWIIDFMSNEFKRAHPDEEAPELQFEMLIGAGFQMIAGAVSEGAEVQTVDPQLSELTDCFTPAKA